MSYVDGFVCAEPTRNRAAFLEHSRLTAAMFREYGALSAVDSWGDDVPDGKRAIIGGFEMVLDI